MGPAVDGFGWQLDLLGALEFALEVAGLALALHGLAVGWTQPSIVERHRAPRASEDVSPADRDDDVLAALVQAVALFAPRLRTLASLLHGRFTRSDCVGVWQSDVVLGAYVSGLVAGAGLESSTPHDLLARCVGVRRAEAAFARYASGAAPWARRDAGGAPLPNGLLEVVEQAGRVDGARIRKGTAAVRAAGEPGPLSVDLLGGQRLERVG